MTNDVVLERNYQIKIISRKPTTWYQNGTAKSNCQRSSTQLTTGSRQYVVAVSWISNKPLVSAINRLYYKNYDPSRKKNIIVATRHE
jgi:hypothetical protein